jgi:hypothetical protein
LGAGLFSFPAHPTVPPARRPRNRGPARCAVAAVAIPRFCAVQALSWRALSPTIVGAPHATNSSPDDPDAAATGIRTHLTALPSADRMRCHELGDGQRSSVPLTAVSTISSADRNAVVSPRTVVRSADHRSLNPERFLRSISRRVMGRSRRVMKPSPPRTGGGFDPVMERSSFP